MEQNKNLRYEEKQKARTEYNYQKLPLLFQVWFSAGLFLFFLWLFVVSLKEEGKTPFNVPDYEMRFCIILLVVVTVIHTFSLSSFYDKERRGKYIRIQTAVFLLWLIFNAFFYFFSKPIFILMFSVLAFVGVYLHPAFPAVYGERCLDLLRKISSPVRNVIRWFVNLEWFISYLLKISVRFLSGRCDELKGDLKRVRSYYSDDGTMFLLYLAFVSFFCLFAIMGNIYIAATIVLFVVWNAKTISNFRPPRFWKPKISYEPSTSVGRLTRYYMASTLRPLGLVQPVASMSFLGVLVAADTFIKLPFPLQLSVWGCCLWNLLMNEIYLYASVFLEEVKIHFKEYDDTA